MFLKPSAQLNNRRQTANAGSKCQQISNKPVEEFLSPSGERDRNAGDPRCMGGAWRGTVVLPELSGPNDLSPQCPLTSDREGCCCFSTPSHYGVTLCDTSAATAISPPPLQYSVKETQQFWVTQPVARLAFSPSWESAPSPFGKARARALTANRKLTPASRDKVNVESANLLPCSK